MSVTGVVNPGQSYEFVFYENDPMRSHPRRYLRKRMAGVAQRTWIGPEIRIRFEVKSGGGSNRPPNAPRLTDPGDWAVYQSGITLKAQANGDPDGDAITHYYFDIFESANTEERLDN